MNLPRGELVRSRVVSDPGGALTAALDCRLTGYAVLEPQDTLLLDGDGRGVLTFAAGVPVQAYHAGSERGGADALAALAVPGPYRVELVETGGNAPPSLDGSPAETVPPGMPAERLAGDPDLAARTRRLAPETAGGGTDRGKDADPVAAFLDDEEKIEAIREQARETARERAAEWGLDDLRE
ncbi:MAG: hypothetical protein ABEJ30_06095 [Halorientalis sp.]